jgi:hypothetical protein
MLTHWHLLPNNSWRAEDRVYNTPHSEHSRAIAVRPAVPCWSRSWRRTARAAGSACTRRGAADRCNRGRRVGGAGCGSRANVGHRSRTRIAIIVVRVRVKVDRQPVLLCTVGTISLAYPNDVKQWKLRAQRLRRRRLRDGASALLAVPDARTHEGPRVSVPCRLVGLTDALLGRVAGVRTVDTAVPVLIDRTVTVEGSLR